MFASLLNVSALSPGPGEIAWGAVTGTFAQRQGKIRLSTPEPTRKMEREDAISPSTRWFSKKRKPSLQSHAVSLTVRRWQPQSTPPNRRTKANLYVSGDRS